MKKFLKILGIVGIVLAVVLAGGFIYFNSSFPKVEPAKNITVEITKARLERGKYLVSHVTVCTDCHSSRDFSKFSGPIKPETEGIGGETFGEEMGFPGSITPKNITPASLGTWSDGEIIRAITCGVTKDEEVIFPLMPYYNYNQLSEEDLYSIVSYIRSLKPVENQTPERELNFPLNYIVNTLAVEKYTPKESVNKDDKIKYGKYLVTIASCGDCHTPTIENEPDMERQFAGGNDFNLPIGTIRTANLTPDIETGIGNWTREDFIKKFKYYDNDTTRNISVGEKDFNSVMPWTMYAGMTEGDLGAIYDYLRTVKPVKNLVQKWTPPQQNLTKK